MEDKKVQALKKIARIMEQNDIKISDITAYLENSKPRAYEIFENSVAGILRNVAWHLNDLKEEGVNFAPVLSESDGVYTAILDVVMEEFTLMEIATGKMATCKLSKNSPIFEGLDNFDLEQIRVINNEGLCNRLDESVHREAIYAVAEAKSADLEYYDDFEI